MSSQTRYAAGGAVLVAGLVALLALGGWPGGQDGVLSRTRYTATDDTWPVTVAPVEEKGRVEPRKNWDSIQAGNLEMSLPPFDELVANAGTVVEGTVASLTDPRYNLPEGKTYTIGEELDLQFLTFHTATVKVDRWLLTDGAMSGDELVLTIPGGCILRILSEADVERLGYADEPDTVKAGDTVCTGEDSYGGLHLKEGEHVILVLDELRLDIKGSSQKVATVAAWGAGAYEVHPDGTLTNEAFDGSEYESAPETVEELESILQGLESS